MDVPSSESFCDTRIDQYPLLMDHMETRGVHEHAIHIPRGNDASSISSHHAQLPTIESLQDESRPSSGTQAAANRTALSMLNRINSRNSSFMRSGDGYSRRRRSPLNSRLWISVELIVTVSQIIASIVVLSLSRHENPKAPLFEWVVGYASGCVATVPILYWRFKKCSRSSEQDSSQMPTGSSQSNFYSEAASYSAVTVTQLPGEETDRSRGTGSLNDHVVRGLRTRLNGVVDHLKMGLDFFFAVWFVVGNVWIFGGGTTPSDAPNLYRLCIVFLTFSCIGYAMPFILCATICCCLPCIISILGFRENFSQMKGATQEMINSLPIYKFNQKKNHSCDEDLRSGGGEGGLFGAGTEKERSISGEDAVCCICLARYEDEDELRELPCLHFFHVGCVDQWLKINALCPLCKTEVPELAATSLPVETTAGVEGVWGVLGGSLEVEVRSCRSCRFLSKEFSRGMAAVGVVAR